MTENEIGVQVVDAAVRVHRELGPGLLESVYEHALAHELSERGLNVQKQVSIPVRYRGVELGEGFKADLIVNGAVVLELKSVEQITAAHGKQLLTYLRMSGCRLGFLLNFASATMKAGIKRTVNGLPEPA